MTDAPTLTDKKVSWIVTNGRMNFVSDREIALATEVQERRALAHDDVRALLAREAERDAMRREIDDLREFIRGVGVNCLRAAGQPSADGGKEGAPLRQEERERDK